jgi:hypothetical protein
MDVTYTADASGILDGLRKLQAVASATSAGGKLQAAYRRAGERYLQGTFNRIVQGDPNWKGLTKATIANRLRHGWGQAPLLQNTGTLLRSYQPGDSNNILITLPNGFEAGSAVPYAKYVDAKRPFADPDFPTQSDIGQIILQGIANETAP